MRAGLAAERPYVAIKDGPFGFVSYDVDGTAAPLGACGADLMLGPLKTGQKLVVHEGWLDGLFYGRMLDLLVVAAGIFLFRPGARRRSRIQGWKT